MIGINLSLFTKFRGSVLNNFSKVISMNMQGQNLFYKFNCNKFSFQQSKDLTKRHFVIMYKFIEDMHYKRVPYIEDHLKLIEKYEQSGNVILGGKFIINKI